MKDYLDGVTKIKRIMGNKIVYWCRVCGLAHSKFSQAQGCCAKKGRK